MLNKLAIDNQFNSKNVVPVGAVGQAGFGL
jgi:hypothetical protein